MDVYLPIANLSVNGLFIVLLGPVFGVWLGCSPACSVSAAGF